MDRANDWTWKRKRERERRARLKENRVKIYEMMTMTAIVYRTFVPKHIHPRKCSKEKKKNERYSFAIKIDRWSNNNKIFSLSLSSFLFSVPDRGRNQINSIKIEISICWQGKHEQKLTLNFIVNFIKQSTHNKIESTMRSVLIFLRTIFFLARFEVFEIMSNTFWKQVFFCQVVHYIHLSRV